MKAIIEWLKDFFGLNKPEPKKSVRTTPVTKKEVAKGPAVKKVTKASLNKLTKAQLEERGRELGIELDKRLVKAKLVDQVFKAEQK
jgi:hypothetical protein